jgi:hypothetical protein
MPVRAGSIFAKRFGRFDRQDLRHFDKLSERNPAYPVTELVEVPGLLAATSCFH